MYETFDKVVIFENTYLSELNIKVIFFLTENKTILYHFIIKLILKKNYNFAVYLIYFEIVFRVTFRQTMSLTISVDNNSK